MVELDFLDGITVVAGHSRSRLIFATVGMLSRPQTYDFPGDSRKPATIPTVYYSVTDLIVLVIQAVVRSTMHIPMAHGLLSTPSRVANSFKTN